MKRKNTLVSPYRNGLRDGKPLRVTKVIKKRPRGPVGSWHHKREVVDNFAVREFAAAWWAANSHVQTIAGAILPGKSKLNVERIRLDTPDHDFIDVDVVKGKERAEVAVVILHGLEANSTAPLPKRMAETFSKRGWTIYLINLRGCSGVPNRNIKAYHLGFTDDIHLVIDHARKNGAKRTYLTGYSLGGNIAVKMLGELGDAATDAGIAGGATFSVPFGAFESSFKLHKGISKLIYANVFLASLKRRATMLYFKHKSKFDEAGINFGQLLRSKSIVEFDELFTCKVFNFDGAKDYYTKADSKPYLSKVKVPLLVVNAKDDPLIAEETLPSQADIGDAPVKLHYTEQGGHCGFLDASSGRTFIVDEIARFIDELEVAHERGKAEVKVVREKRREEVRSVPGLEKNVTAKSVKT